MLVRKFSIIVAAAGMAVASIANAASAPIPSRIGAPVTNANYQDDDDDNGSTAVILGVVLVVLIGIAAVSGGGEDSPSSP